MTSHTAVSNSNTHLIIVMGVSGSGKSTLANRLGQIYGYHYIDGDDFHSEASRSLMAQGIALTDAEREPWVATLKTYLQECALQHRHVILAFSGLKRKHRNALRSAGLRTIFVYLNGSKVTIQERINHRKDHFMAPALLDSQFASMEDPLSEPDVHLIDVSEDFEQVVTNAQKIICDYLLTTL